MRPASETAVAFTRIMNFIGAPFVSFLHDEGRAPESTALTT
jgi:hypothetical protein